MVVWVRILPSNWIQMAFRILVQVICLWADRAVSELDLLFAKTAALREQGPEFEMVLAKFSAIVAGTD